MNNWPVDGPQGSKNNIMKCFAYFVNTLNFSFAFSISWEITEYSCNLSMLK